MLGGSLTFPERIRDLTGLGKLTARCLTLDLPQWRSWEEAGRVWCVSSHTKRCWGRRHTRKALGLHSGSPLSSRRAEACPLNILDLLCYLESQSARCHHANLPSSAEVWGKSSLLLENHRGFTFLTKTEKKASTENIELKGITILFVEDIKSPRYIRLTCLHLPNGAGCFWGLFKH